MRPVRIRPALCFVGLAAAAAVAALGACSGLVAPGLDWAEADSGGQTTEMPTTRSSAGGTTTTNVVGLFAPGGGGAGGGGLLGGSGGLGGWGGAGGAGGDPVVMVPDFGLRDVNPNSASFDTLVSPRDYLQRISAWYFGTAT